MYHCEESLEPGHCRLIHHPFESREEKPLSNNDVRAQIRQKMLGIDVDLRSFTRVNDAQTRKDIQTLQARRADYQRRHDWLPENDETFDRVAYVLAFSE